MGQAQIISACRQNNGDLAGVWAPNTYTLEEKAGAKVLCSGKDGGAIVPGALIARADYAEENPEHVAKFLAVYLRALVVGDRATKPEALQMMRAFYKQGGVELGRRPRSKSSRRARRSTLDRAARRCMDRGAGAVRRWTVVRRRSATS